MRLTHNAYSPRLRKLVRRAHQPFFGGWHFPHTQRHRRERRDLANCFLSPCHHFVRCLCMHARVGFGRALPGKAIRHACARCGTNHSVLGASLKRGSVVANAPSARESRLVHRRTTAVLPELASVMEKLALGGILKQAESPVTVPRSIVQNPPGVRG